MIWFKAAAVLATILIVLSNLGRMNNAGDVGELYKGMGYAVVFSLLLIAMTIWFK